MSNPTSQNPSPVHRQRAVARDSEAASQVLIDLTEAGVPADHIRTDPEDAAAVSRSPADTARSDVAFGKRAGKTIGKGWLVAFAAGTLLGAIIFTIVLRPWTSSMAAGITVVAALGMGYMFAAVGFIQGAIARFGERGDERLLGGEEPWQASQEVGGPRGRREDVIEAADEQVPVRDGSVEIVVDAHDDDELRAAREVFAAHRGQRVE